MEFYSISEVTRSISFFKCPNVKVAEWDVILGSFVCLQVILDAWENGVNPSGNSTNPSNWDFCSSFFFAGTVVTTIGEHVWIFLFLI